MASPIDYEAISLALFTLIDGAFAWANSSRLVQPITAVGSFPAMYCELVEVQYLTATSLTQSRPTGLPAKIYVDCEVWVYTDAGTSGLVETELSKAHAIIEGALQPPPAPSAQTLGGLVRHCWIDGKVQRDNGRLLTPPRGQIIIPIRMLVPGVSPPGVAAP